MGYIKNILISIPMALIFYLLTEKIITNITSENKYSDKIQKSFIIEFIVGLFFIALGLTAFNVGSNLENQSLRFSMYGAGGFLILNSVIFNWDGLDDGSKMIILSLSVAGLIIYSYNNNDNDNYTYNNNDNDNYK